MKKGLKLIIAAAALNAALPLVIRGESSIVYADHDGDDPRLAAYVLPGIVAPPFDEYNMFADSKVYSFPGDFFLVDYGKDVYSPEDIAKFVAEHAKKNRYQEIRLLTISIGDQITPLVALALEDSDIVVKSFAIDPCVDPDNLWPGVRTPLRIGMPLARIARFAFGWLGQQRLILWDSAWRSFAEIESQAWAIAYGNDYAYEAKMLSGNAKVAGVIISEQNEFMNPALLEQYYHDVPVTKVEATKHCRFAENWFGYLDALNDLGFYTPLKD